MAWCVVACPLGAQETPLSAFEPREILYFDRNATELSPLGRQKLGALVREWGRTGTWVIGIPRNSGASDAVNQGRVRTLVGALMELGVSGVRSLPVPPVSREVYEPMLVGKLSQGEPAGLDPGLDSGLDPGLDPNADAPIDPNEDEPAVPPSRPPAKQKLPPPPPAVEAPPPASSPRTSGPAAAPSGWVALSGLVAYQSASVAASPAARMEATPHPVVGIAAIAAPGALRLEAGYAKSARNAFGAKEQGEPARNLDVSDASTTFFEQASFTLALRQGLPLQLTYVGETQAVTAVLSKNTLILDRGGEAWQSIVDDVRYAYRTRLKTFGLDWRFGDADRDARTYWLGAYSEKAEKPFSLYESGAFENRGLYTATYTVAGLRGGMRGDPFREGLAFDDIDLKIGRAKGLDLVDKYRLLVADVTKQGFNEFSLRVSPRFLVPLGRGGFLRFSLPLAYTLNTSKSQTTPAGAGYTQLTGLYGQRFSAALRMEVGFRN